LNNQSISIMADGRKNNGGARPGAGRPPKADEQKLIERLSPLSDVAYQALDVALHNGEPWAVKMWFEYRYGKPTQRQEISGPNGQEISAPPIVFYKPEPLDLDDE